MIFGDINKLYCADGSRIIKIFVPKSTRVTSKCELKLDIRSKEIISIEAKHTKSQNKDVCFLQSNRPSNFLLLLLNSVLVL